MVKTQTTWKDPWLSTFLAYKIMSRKLQNAIVSLVTDLRQGEHWNENLLDKLFTPVESAAIKIIPIREGS